MIDIYCQICFELIAKADPKSLCTPITGEMFKSPDTHHGIPDPFPPEAGWEDMKCPVCQHRPFVFQDQVMIQVEGTVSKTFEPMFLHPCGIEMEADMPPLIEQIFNPERDIDIPMHKRRGRKPMRIAANG